MPGNFPGAPDARSPTFKSKAPLRLIFAGSGTFGATTLEHLHASPHTVCMVLSQPDRPAGRKLRLRPTAVSAVARAEKLLLLHPETLDDPSRTKLAALGADALVVADFGRLIPASWLTLCPGGSLNIHASLLPRWRGAAPMARAIEAGDAESGCTIMLMDEGLDTGDILLRDSLALTPEETTATAEARLAPLGAELLLRYLEDFDPDHPARQPQDETQACHARALHKDETPIDWNAPSDRIAAKVRAFNPWPVATTQAGDETLRLWHAIAHTGPVPAPPGHTLGCGHEGLWVACGAGRVQITELQRPGGRRMAARDFCNARDLSGMRLT